MDKWRFWWPGGSTTHDLWVGEYAQLSTTLLFWGPGATGEVKGKFWHPVPIDVEGDALAMRRAIVEGLASACGGRVTWGESEATDA